MNKTETAPALRLAIPKRGPVIAIDGPAGTGKSSVTKALAERLGYVHVDTGALYRAIAYLCLQKNVLGQKDQITEIARSAHLQFRREAKKKPANRVVVNGKDVTEHIRSLEVTRAVSEVSAVAGVRAALLGLQRRLGCIGKSILEGRDIGTVIFPDADVKIYLNASVEERAKRRLAEIEQTQKPPFPSFEELKNAISQRDQLDSQRDVAPLKKAEDALVIDTTKLELKEVIDQIEEIIRQRID